MQTNRCTVCENTELTLKDGFYYCVECGTQNTNVMETVVEQKALADGTFALVARRKINKLQDSKIRMSGEWYKWYAFNFIIQGLADELVAVGAKPSFKIKLLWIWTRYIKKYQNKSELGLAVESQKDNNGTLALPSFMVEENSTSNTTPDEDENEVGRTTKSKRHKNVIMNDSRRDIKFISISVIISMLYLALNFDESDIQLSHIFKFIKEKRVNISNLHRFVPNDVHVKTIPQWTEFLHSKCCNMHNMRALVMSLLRKLDLGTPKVPNLKKIVDNFLTELCLPNEMKPIIYSLMHFHFSCDFLDMNNASKEFLVRIPDYEGVVMSYVLAAIKMCFGLDGDYELRVSNAVDKINVDRDLSKSHRSGKYSETSSRLFSFTEWCSYLQFRKIMLCKCCIHMADQHYLDIDDYVYLQHEERIKYKKDLQDETAMDLLKKLPLDSEGRVIPKELFMPTLTPMSEYTEIIIEHSQDPEVKLLLSEDFTQYSIKYACEYLNLVDTNGENVIKGVSENGKTVSKVILGTIVTKKCKSEMIYVKNCENINWRKTNPPTIEHVTCVEQQNECNDKESDHGYDSENLTSDKEVNQAPDQNKPSGMNEIVINCSDQNSKDVKQVIIIEENEDKNIFDDLFEELDLKDEMEQNNADNVDPFDLNDEENPPLQNTTFPNDDVASLTDSSDTGIGSATFNPDTFDREQTIKELILYACKTYKIAVPAEYKTQEPRKRKREMFDKEAGTSTPKKRAKTNRGEGKKKVDEVLRNYYSQLHSDFINRIQQQVSLAVQNTHLEGTVSQQNETANLGNVDRADDAISDDVERGSISAENLQNQTNANLQNNALEPDPNLDITSKTVATIDENLESILFEEDEDIKADDLIPKGDSRFDEEKYDVQQLYINYMELNEEDIYDIKDDPKMEEILGKKIEECKNNTEFAKVAEPVVDPVKTTYESDSEDDIPLNILQEERNRIEDMIAREESFDPLINKENISEFKYWIRHYDTDFMTRSLDWHEKFDEELKLNTPASFYFVIKECASVLGCSTFYLYKNMQNLEQYLIAIGRHPD